MDCFGTYLTHAQSCDNVRVHSTTEWTASLHTLRMPKAVITFVFTVKTAKTRKRENAKTAKTMKTRKRPKVVLFSGFQFLVFWFSRFSRFSGFLVPLAAPFWPGRVFYVLSLLGHFRVFAFSFFPVSVLGIFAFLRFRVFAFRRPHPRSRDTDFVCTARRQLGEI